MRRRLLLRARAKENLLKSQATPRRGGRYLWNLLRSLLGNLFGLGNLLGLGLGFGFGFCIGPSSTAAIFGTSSSAPAAAIFDTSSSPAASFSAAASSSSFVLVLEVQQIHPDGVLGDEQIDVHPTHLHRHLDFFASVVRGVRRRLVALLRLLAFQTLLEG